MYVTLTLLTLRHSPDQLCYDYLQMLPLQKIPMYQANAYPNRYWTAARNTTAWNLEMAELTNAGNTMARLMLKDLTPTLPGAHVGKLNDVDEVESVVIFRYANDFI